jgi:hypothetical protein
MRQIGRRRAIRRRTLPNHYWGWGPQAEDAISGFLRPVALMVRQRGVLVSVDERDGSLDKPREW